MLARLDDAGAPLGRPVAISEDRAGHQAALAALGPPPALIVMEATGHYWKNLFGTLVAAGHEVALINPLAARRFQEASLARTKTDAIDAAGLARLAFEKRRRPRTCTTQVAEALRELVRHRDRLRQDFDDRVRQLHRLVDLGFPEFTRYVRSLDSMLATCLLAEYPTAAGLRACQPEAAREAPLRRPPQGRRRARRTARRGGPALGRPAPRAGLRAAGAPHLPGSRALAPAARRDRARHRGPARRPRGRAAAHQHRGDRPALGRPHHRRRRRSGTVPQRGCLRGLCRRRAGPQPVRQARRAVAPPRPLRQRRTASRPLDAGARRRAPKSLAPRLLRAPARRRQAAQARAHRRHAQAAPRRLQRRQKPQTIRHPDRAGAGGVGHPCRSRPRLLAAKKPLARRDGISGLALSALALTSSRLARLRIPHGVHRRERVIDAVVVVRGVRPLIGRPQQVDPQGRIAPAVVPRRLDQAVQQSALAGGIEPRSTSSS